VRLGGRKRGREGGKEGSFGRRGEEAGGREGGRDEVFHLQRGAGKQGEEGGREGGREGGQGRTWARKGMSPKASREGRCSGLLCK